MEHEYFVISLSILHLFHVFIKIKIILIKIKFLDSKKIYHRVQKIYYN